MEYIFFYSYQLKLGNPERDHARYICTMKPGLTMLEMIHEVEDCLKLRGNHWDYKVYNVIPNDIPVPIPTGYVNYEKILKVLAENPIPADLLERCK